MKRYRILALVVVMGVQSALLSVLQAGPFSNRLGLNRIRTPASPGTNSITDSTPVAPSRPRRAPFSNSSGKVPVVPSQEAAPTPIMNQLVKFPSEVKPTAAIEYSRQPTPISPTAPSINLNVVTATPMISIETTGPIAINVGKTATFTITVRNIGDSPAQELLVQAALPESTELRSATPEPDVEDSILMFPIGELPAKAKQQIQLNLIPKEQGAIDLAAKASFAMYTQSIVQVRQPKLALSIESQEEARYGDVVVYKLTISNTGDGPAEDVTVTQLIPEIANDADGIQAHAMIKQMPERIALLPAGESKEVELRAIAHTSGVIRADIVAQAEGGLEAVTAAQVRVRRPMLEISVDGPQIRYAERVGSYIIRVSNPGDAPAENVKVVAKMPTGLRVSAIEKRASLDKNRGVLNWNLLTIEPGNTEILKFRAKAIQEGDQQQEINVHADGDLTAQAKLVTRVLGFADILMTVTDTVSPIEVNGTVEFEISIRNRGTKAAQNVVIKAIVPQMLEPVESTEYLALGKNLTFEPIPQIEPSEEIVLRFRAIGRKPGDHTVRITLSSDSLTREVVAEEGTLFYTPEPEPTVMTQEMSVR